MTDQTETIEQPEDENGKLEKVGVETDHSPS